MNDERLIADCRAAADIMEQLGTFPTGVAILRGAANAIVRLQATVDALSEERRFGAPKTFCGVPIDEAVDVVLRSHPAAHSSP